MINTKNAFINEINEMNISLEKALEIVVMSTNLDEDTIQLLIDHGADINVIDNDGSNLLINALEECRLDTAKILINKGIDVNFIPEDGISALMIACTMGGNRDQVKANLSESTLARFEMYSQDDFTELVQLLIAKGADVNAKNNEGITALLAAVMANNIDAIKLLIDNGADITARDNNGLSALYYAVVANNTEAINLLIDKGADVNQKIVFGKEGDRKEENTLLSFTVMQDLINKNTLPEKQQATLDTIQLLIDLGADVNAGFPLYYAAFTVKSKEIVQLLLNNGADVNQLLNEASVLDMLVKHGHYDMIKLFIQNDADINLKNVAGKTPLMNAINLKKKDPIAKIQKNDSLNALQKLLLLESYEIGNADRIIKLLVDHPRADLNAQCDITKDTALIQATKYNDYESVKLLLEKGADVDIQNSQDSTALLYAENKRIRNLLLRYDTKGLSSDAELQNKLDQIHSNKSSDLSKELLALTEESSAIKDSLLRELYELKKKTNPKMISAFEQKDTVFLKEATKELKTLKYVNVLNLIKENFPLDFIEVVLQQEKGGDVNVVDSSGNTPLIYAVAKKDTKLIELLLRNGADIDIANNENFDCIDSALASYDYDIANYILQYGQDNKHRPQKLVKILSNCTIDTPFKLTTHLWEDPKGELFEKYNGFDGFMNAVKKHFESMSSELIELSPNLHKKIYAFLIDENPDLNYSWCTKTPISIGWSNLEGLKEHCNSGKLPKDFKLPKSIFIGRKQIATFGEIVDLFKQEIEVRAGYQITSLPNVEFSRRDFYTDTQNFSTVIAKIFAEMNKREEYPNIEVTNKELDDRSIEIRITQVGSFGNKNSNEMLQEVEDGDFADLKASLTNLCDWSIESSCEDENFRVNFLHSNNVKDIEILPTKPKGFTHILRFYK